jgi:hypothetical protein
LIFSDWPSQAADPPPSKPIARIGDGQPAPAHPDAP